MLYLVVVVDRVSNRCIVRMDHFCPWTNNAIGAANQKMFILFVIYTDVAAMYYYYLLAIIMVSYSVSHLKVFLLKFSICCSSSFAMVRIVLILRAIA